MKKLMLVLIAAILAMFLGCSKSSDSPTSPSPAGISPLAGTWKTSGGTAPNDYTLTIVVNNDGSWTYTTTGAAKSSTGAQCTGSGTSSTSGVTIVGGDLTIVNNTDNCPPAGKTAPYTQTGTYILTGGTDLMISESGGGITFYTKQ